MNKQKKKWFRRIAIALFAPWGLLLLLSILIYVPFIQNILKNAVTSYVSTTTGFRVSINKVQLSFPLDLAINGTTVISTTDTLLTADKLVVDVGVIKLLSGEFHVDGIVLSKATLNSSNLINGILLKGRVGELSLHANKMDLPKDELFLSKISLEESDLKVVLKDTVSSPPKKPSSPLKWKIKLEQLELKKIRIACLLHAEATRIMAFVNEAEFKGGEIDLRKKSYHLAHLSVSNSSFNYDQRNQIPQKGFDPSHIALRKISIQADSLMNSGLKNRAALRYLSFVDRSGLKVNSVKGTIVSDEQSLRLPFLQLITPHSIITWSGQTDWSILKDPTKGVVSSSLIARLGKQDAIYFANRLPKKYWKSIPSKPIILRFTAQGNATQSKLSLCHVDIPTILSFSAVGEVKSLMNSAKRSAKINYQLLTKNLSLITSLLPNSTRKRVRIPYGMKIKGRVTMLGTHYTFNTQLHEKQGFINIAAQYDNKQKWYKVESTIENLQINHFLPKDSIYSLSASFTARGKGTDLYAKRTELTARFDLQQLQIGHKQLSGFWLNADIKDRLASVEVASENDYLNMDVLLKSPLRKEAITGELTMNVREVDLYRIRLLPKPLNMPTAFTLQAFVKKDNSSLQIHSGDLDFSFISNESLRTFIKKAKRSTAMFMKQLATKSINELAIKEELPSADINFSIGRENILSQLLLRSKLAFQKGTFHLSSSAQEGINADGLICSLDLDSVSLDTIDLGIKQDELGISFHTSICHHVAKKIPAFQAHINGNIRNNNASLLLKFINDKGSVGTYLGVEAKLENDGYAFHLFPESPTLLARTFKLNKDNNIFWTKDNRFIGELQLQDDKGAGLFIHSASDMPNQQEVVAELKDVSIQEIVHFLPFLPNVDGLFSARAEYNQKDKEYRIGADAKLSQFKYNNQEVGNLHLTASYLPQDTSYHQLNVKLKHNEQEVLSADGIYHRSNKGLIDVHGLLKSFPLDIVNPFLPHNIQLSGTLSGDLIAENVIKQPKVNGQLLLNSTSAYLPEAALRIRLDDKPIKIIDNQLSFDHYTLLAAGKNPLVISGEVDFRKFDQMGLNIKWNAENFQLLDAPRTKESLVYGKLYANINGTLRGTLNALVLRGDVRLLNNTDVTYVVKDSPLEVKDRLSEMVTFVDFKDTMQVSKEKPMSQLLGGLDMLMQIQIDPSVKLKVDLSADRTSKVELEGGGELSLQYTSQRDMLLYGRYTFTGGMFRYNLPVIPLKSFAIESGSYVEWTGNIMEPMLHFKASEKIRATVADENKNNRQVIFDVSVSLQNSFKDLALLFNLSAPEDMSLQNKLASMTQEERNKLAITLLATGMYMPPGAELSSSGGINMGNTMSNFIQNEISAIGGNTFSNIGFTFGMDAYDQKGAEGSSQRTDYTYSFSQQFYNNRIRVVIGGKVSTGETADKNQSFIDNISLEYSLDNGRTKYIKLYHNKNYDSFLEGEITKTGIGVVLHKRMLRLGDLFIFRNKKK